VLSDATVEATEESIISFCGASRERFGGLSDEEHVTIFFQSSRLDNNLAGQFRFIKSVF